MVLNREFYIYEAKLLRLQFVFIGRFTDKTGGLATLHLSQFGKFRRSNFISIFDKKVFRESKDFPKKVDILYRIIYRYIAFDIFYVSILGIDWPDTMCRYKFFFAISTVPSQHRDQCRMFAVGGVTECTSGYFKEWGSSQQ